jgi:hypothetical protein
MFEGFTLDRIDVGDAELRVRHGGSVRMSTSSGSTTTFSRRAMTRPTSTTSFAGSGRSRAFLRTRRRRGWRAPDMTIMGRNRSGSFPGLLEFAGDCTGQHEGYVGEPVC